MNIAIILSGGTGTRIGDATPKQYICVNEKPIISYCLETISKCGMIDAIIIVLNEEWKDFTLQLTEKLDEDKPVLFAPAGKTRQYSIYNGLLAARAFGAKDDDVVLIHDSARPMVTSELITDCLETCKQADGVMPAIRVKDTTYLSEDGKHIQSLLDRKKLCCGQAPEAFKFGKYLKAHQSISNEELLKINGSTEIAFLAGMDCQIIEGDPMNIKITTREDLLTFQGLVTNNI